jgi:hypothetical protein
MAKMLETKEVHQWRAKVATFNFDVEAVGGRVTALLRRAVELEQERLALSIDDDIAVVEAASAQERARWRHHDGQRPFGPRKSG